MSLVFASDEERAIETYCFSSEETRIRVEKRLSSMLVPSDSLTSEKNCLTLQMRPHRRELLQSYTYNLDPGMRVSYSSAEIKREACTLKVEKIRTLKKKNTNVNVSSFPDATEGQQTESAKDVMQIQTLDKFSFVVAQDAIEGQCKYINKDLYEITISARRDPKPIVPPNLPPGTIVLLPEKPDDQKTLSVTTTVQLTRGSQIEMGSLVKDLRKKAHDVSIKPEAQIGIIEQNKDEKVFLGFQ